MTTDPDDPQHVHRILWLACTIALVVLLAAYVLSAANRYLVNDDYQILYTAWLRSTGKIPGRDFSIYSYHLLVDLLTPVFRLFPHSLTTLYVGRAVMIGTLIGVILLLYSIGTRMFGRSAGLIAPVLALSAQAMTYRALDLRPDLITTLLWLAIVRLLLDERVLHPRYLVLLGSLAGIVFLNRFKAALIVPIILVVLAQRVYEEGASAREHRRRLLRATAIVGAAGLAPLALYAGWLGIHHELRTYLDVNAALIGIIENAAAAPRRLRTTTLRAAFRQDRVLWLLVVIGLVLRATRARGFTTRVNVLTASVLALALASVVLNPAYYAYNLVTLVPLASLFAAYPVGTVVEEGGTSRHAALAVLVIGLPFITGWRPMLRQATEQSIAHQLALNQFLLTYTAPSSPVFALEGIGLFRPSIYHWRMPDVLRTRYVHGAMNYARELRATPPEIIVITYRLPSWLLPRDRAFITDHYVPLTPLIAVQGHTTGGTTATTDSFELLSSDRYEIVATGPGRCRLDGLPAVGDSVVLSLERGNHVIRTDHGTKCTVRRFYPAQARQLIANPHQLPYLVAPDLTLLPGM